MTDNNFESQGDSCFIQDGSRILRKRDVQVHEVVGYKACPLVTLLLILQRAARD